MTKPLQKIQKVVTTVLMTVAIIVAGVGLLATVGHNGTMKVLVVQTGSMTPTIPVGSLVITRPASEYQVGDVITFRLGSNFVTHRVIAKVNGAYQVKGDANNAPDGNLVLPSMVVGKLMVSLPGVGRFIQWVKTPLGFSLLIILPATLVVIQEILAIGRELAKAEALKLKAATPLMIDVKPSGRRSIAKKNLVKAKKRSIPAKKKVAVVIKVNRTKTLAKKSKSASLGWTAPARTRVVQASIMLFLTVGSLLGGTKAYFSNIGLSNNNVFSGGQYISSGMVINELMYVSSGSCAEQVIELWNGSNVSVDLKQWRLRQGANTFTIQGNPNLLLPGGFALIAKSKTSFNNCYGMEPSGVELLNVTSHPDLNTTSGTLELLPPTPSTTVVDQVRYGGTDPIAAADKSIERKQLGFDTAAGASFTSSDFTPQLFPTTFGFSLPTPQTVVINEFMVQPDSGSPQEFIELRNATGASINISGWQLFSSNGTVLRATVPASTTLAAGQRYLHQFSGGGNELPNVVDRLYFKDTSGVIKDAFTYGPTTNVPISGTSWARIPEGTSPSNWVLDASETPGAANVL